MPPSGTTPQDTIRWLTTILASLAKSNGGELRVSRKAMRQVQDEQARQVLLEDLDSPKDEIVLRFGSKHSAIYPVEPECPQTAKPAQPTTIQPTSSEGSKKRVYPAMSEEKLAAAARGLKRLQTVAALKREAEERQRQVPFPPNQ